MHLTIGRHLRLLGVIKKTFTILSVFKTQTKLALLAPLLTTLCFQCGSFHLPHIFIH